MSIHPTRTISFDDLYAGLSDAKDQGLVNEQIGEDGLRLYCYTKSAVYERMWNPYTILARGLILDVEKKEVVATPFPKFFNLSENNESIPDLPFEVYEKVDGSLIICFYHNGKWRTATKGSFNSDQAKWAWNELDRLNVFEKVFAGNTYLFEATYAENRIVVHYSKDELVLLSGYYSDGIEFNRWEIEESSNFLGIRSAKRYNYTSISDLIVHTKGLPVSEEGYVIRFSNGHRLKIKGDEYCRVHALVSRCTPLAMWEAMRAGDDLQALRKDLPEEFWKDFDAIINIIQNKIDEIMKNIHLDASRYIRLTNKEVGLLSSDEISSLGRAYIFESRKGIGFRKIRDKIFMNIRPTGNNLEGYIPSYGLSRVVDDE